jgi:ribosomal protein S27AE
VLFGKLAWVRRAALVLLLALIAAATFVQFRERCPRCGRRGGWHRRLFLPAQCPGCGAEFVRQN